MSLSRAQIPKSCPRRVKKKDRIKKRDQTGKKNQIPYRSASLLTDFSILRPIHVPFVFKLKPMQAARYVRLVSLTLDAALISYSLNTTQKSVRPSKKFEIRHQSTPLLTHWVSMLSKTS
jgi:hypothetical protein